MMFVWWAVFFFAGTFFPSACSGSGVALGAAFLLFFLHNDSSLELRRRFFLTCVSCILVLTAASLTPVRPIGSSRRYATGSESLPAPVRAAREGMIRIIDDGRLTDRSRSLLRALLIADRKTLSPDTRRDFRRTGTAHYLALSGLHLGLIAVPLFGILALAGARGIVRDLLALFILSFYAAAAGRPGSLLRALSMMAVLRSHRLAGIKTGPGRCVISGAFLVCILDPASLNDTGFLLSFNAAAGVAFLGIPACAALQRRLNLSRLLLIPLQSLLMSVCVQLSMLPVVIGVFGSAPLLGPVMSVLLALPITLLLYGGFIYIIAGHLFPAVAVLPVNMLSALVCGLVRQGAGFPGPVLISGDMDIRFYLPGLVVMSLSFVADRYRVFLLSIGLLMSVISFSPVLAGRESAGNDPIHLNDHATLLAFGNNRMLILDRAPGKWSVTRLSREVRMSGVKALETLVVLDAGEFDHEGLSSLVDELGIEKVLLSPWLETKCPGTCSYLYIRADTTIEGGGQRVTIGAPAVLPVRGASASGKDASLTISPLD